MLTLPPAGSVLAAFQADSAHTSQMHDEPQSVFQAGVIAPQPGDGPTVKRYGFTQHEADLAYFKATRGGWIILPADFAYWTKGPTELRWAAQIYQVGGPALCQARGLDPEIGRVLARWQQWLACWRYTFPAGTRLPTVAQLATLVLKTPPAPTH